MQASPSATALLEATREFLETEIGPTLSDPRLKFRLLVAMNALGIVGRELELEEVLLETEWRELSGLLGADGSKPESLEGLKRAVTGLNAALCARIRRGDPPAGCLEVLIRLAVDKLRVSSPGYLKRYAP